MIIVCFLNAIKQKITKTKRLYQEIIYIYIKLEISKHLQNLCQKKINKWWKYYMVTSGGKKIKSLNYFLYLNSFFMKSLVI